MDQHGCLVTTKALSPHPTIPHSNLNKRHNALSYHCVREAIAANILYLIHIDGKLNPSDVLTKFLSWAKFWPLIQPFLFWKGETLKEIHPNTPITDVISLLATESPSGLWGVSSRNQVSPSGHPSSNPGSKALTNNNLILKKISLENEFMKILNSKNIPSIPTFGMLGIPEPQPTNQAISALIPSNQIQNLTVGSLLIPKSQPSLIDGTLGTVSLIKWNKPS